jgi:site-specific DNA-methyltransferase (adenine-specific)
MPRAAFILSKIARWGGMIRVEHGDMLEAIPRLVAEGIVVDAIVTDPPYHLIQASRNGSLRQNDVSKPFGRAEARGGFMGQRWDGGDIAFQPETWRTLLPILRPGGFLLCFGGGRTHHRLWSAIEDAGFVIQDTIMWLFGEGFPKGHSQLKPAWEPICVAYKAGGKRTLQIDESRIGTDETLASGACKLWRHYRDGKEPSANRRYTANGGTNFAALPGPRGGSPDGRWPANVCHDGSDEVMEAFGGTAQSRIGFRTERSKNAIVTGTNWWVNNHKSVEYPGEGDGTAARFFYCAKADAEDRWGSKHPTVKSIELMKWLVPLVTPKGGLVLDCFAGTGTIGVAALATGRNGILIEKEPAYIADIRERLAFYEGHGRHSLVSKNRNRCEARGTLL